MQAARLILIAVLAAVPPGTAAHAGSGSGETPSGCFFEADFLAKRIAGDSREARAAEARRWYVRRLVRDALDIHRRAANMSPVPANYHRGS